MSIQARNKLTISEDDIASLYSPESGVAISFTSNQPGMQGWSGTTDTYDGSDARKTIHGGKSTRDQADGYLNEVSGAAFAMEFHGSEYDCPRRRVRKSDVGLEGLSGRHDNKERG